MTSVRRTMDDDGFGELENGSSREEFYEIVMQRAIAPSWIILMDNQLVEYVGARDFWRGLGSCAKYFRDFKWKIEAIHARGWKLNNEGKRGWKDLLPKLPYLRRLDIGKLDMYTNGRCVLSESLAQLTQLRHLVLEDSFIPEELALALGNMTQLQHLNVRNGVRYGGALALAFLTELAKLNQLQHLNVGLNRFGYGEGGRGGCMKELIDTLSGLTKLQHIDMESVVILDADAQALAPVLGKLVHLKYINIKGNAIHIGGAQGLASELGKLVHLEFVDASKNHISAVGIQALRTALGNVRVVRL